MSMEAWIVEHALLIVVMVRLASVLVACCLIGLIVGKLASDAAERERERQRVRRHLQETYPDVERWTWER